MKVDFALIRKEADLYRSQGLHGEALQIYAKYIARSAKIDPSTKSSIKKQIQLIEFEMKCGDTGETQELSAGGSGFNKRSWEATAIEADLLWCAQDQAQPPGCSQKDESDIEGLDWADNRVDIYALVPNENDRSSPQILKGKGRLNDTEDPKRLLNQDSPSRKCFHRDYAAKSFIKSIVAFVLVGSIFFYFVDWFSEVKKDEGGEVVQKIDKVVVKKIPTFAINEPSSILPDNEMEDQSAVMSKEKAVIGDTQPVVDSADMQEEVKNFSYPTNDNKIANRTPIDDFQKGGTGHSEKPAAESKDTKIAPVDPDPASVIDYVLKKQGLQP